MQGQGAGGRVLRPARFRATPERGAGPLRKRPYATPAARPGRANPGGSPARPSAPAAPAGRTWRARAAGSSSAGGVTVAHPAAVLLRRQGCTATLCVSDPTRTGEALELEWDHPVREAPDPVEILATGPRLRPRVTPGEACATHVCEAALSR
ncbi:polysaccharide lyase beta-sandwich domain-containing protein [Streptomyces werraensis]|uniref:polysaccharide lyase beta-sandwich domain-containing protein n=1 Tax=Streptomyces werraensis TaxID=68284 RepID=UPI003829629C